MRGGKQTSAGKVVPHEGQFSPPHRHHYAWNPGMVSSGRADRSVFGAGVMWWKIALGSYWAASSAICLFQLGRDWARGHDQELGPAGVVACALLGPLVVWTALGFIFQQSRKSPAAVDPSPGSLSHNGQAQHVNARADSVGGKDFK